MKSEKKGNKLPRKKITGGGPFGELEEGAEKVGEGAVKEGEGAVKEGENVAKNTAEKAENTAENTAEKAENTAENTAEKAENTAENTAEKAENTAGEVTKEGKKVGEGGEEEEENNNEEENDNGQQNSSDDDDDDGDDGDDGDGDDGDDGQQNSNPNCPNGNVDMSTLTPTQEQKIVDKISKDLTDRICSALVLGDDQNEGGDLIQSLIQTTTNQITEIFSNPKLDANNKLADTILGGIQRSYRFIKGSNILLYSLLQDDNGMNLYRSLMSTVLVRAEDKTSDVPNYIDYLITNVIRILRQKPMVLFENPVQQQTGGKKYKHGRKKKKERTLKKSKKVWNKTMKLEGGGIFGNFKMPTLYNQETIDRNNQQNEAARNTKKALYNINETNYNDSVARSTMLNEGKPHFENRIANLQKQMDQQKNNINEDGISEMEKNKRQQAFNNLEFSHNLYKNVNESEHASKSKSTLDNEITNHKAKIKELQQSPQADPTNEDHKNELNAQKAEMEQKEKHLQDRNSLKTIEDGIQKETKTNMARNKTSDDFAGKAQNLMGNIGSRIALPSMFSKKISAEDKARNTSLINEESELRKKKAEDLKNIDKANPFARKKIESTFEAKKNEIHAQRALLKGDLKGAEKHKKLQEFHETKSKLLEAQEKRAKGTGTQAEVDALQKQHDQLKGEADKLTTLGSLKRGSAVTGSALSSVGSAAGTQAKGMLSSLTGAVLQSAQQPAQQPGQQQQQDQQQQLMDQQQQQMGEEGAGGDQLAQQYATDLLEKIASRLGQMESTILDKITQAVYYHLLQSPTPILESLVNVMTSTEVTQGINGASAKILFCSCLTNNSVLLGDCMNKAYKEKKTQAEKANQSIDVGYATSAQFIDDFTSIMENKLRIVLFPETKEQE
jgi:hypothetical protein